jgi:hypothetical protein
MNVHFQYLGLVKACTWASPCTPLFGVACWHTQSASYCMAVLRYLWHILYVTCANYNQTYDMNKAGHDEVACVTFLDHTLIPYLNG